MQVQYSRHKILFSRHSVRISLHGVQAFGREDRPRYFEMGECLLGIFSKLDGAKPIVYFHAHFESAVRFAGRTEKSARRDAPFLGGYF